MILSKGKPCNTSYNKMNYDFILQMNFLKYNVDVHSKHDMHMIMQKKTSQNTHGYTISSNC